MASARPKRIYAEKGIEMYNITQGYSSTKGNELGIFEGVGDVYSQEDLDLFFSTFYSYDLLGSSFHQPLPD